MGLGSSHAWWRLSQDQKTTCFQGFKSAKLMDIYQKRIGEVLLRVYRARWFIQGLTVGLLHLYFCWDEMGVRQTLLPEGF